MRRSRYRPLADHLAASTETDLTLTFAEIEAIIGGPLPVTAMVAPSWWSNTTTDYTGLWRALGWRAHLEQRSHRVHFVRVTPND
jgi:hypothetical protein